MGSLWVVVGGGGGIGGCLRRELGLVGIYIWDLSVCVRGG